jgi:pimeloyl-ACP methyl ester carboxylesterase
VAGSATVIEICSTPSQTATRACWYDRAGEGWSDPAPDAQSTFATANDLHILLHTAHVTPPYVLVGHSVGGFAARAFYRLYPSEVAGMVLVEASHEDYDARIRVGNAWCPRCPRRPAIFLARVLGAVGLFRLFASEPGPAPDGMTPQEWAAIISLQRQYTTVATGLRQDPRVNEEQMRTVRDLGSIPLVVLTGGRTFPSSDPREELEYARAQRTWIAMRAELARLSTRGRHVIVENSGHMMPYEAPEAVIGAVLDIVAEVRRNGSQPVSSSGTK